MMRRRRRRGTTTWATCSTPWTFTTRKTKLWVSGSEQTSLLKLKIAQLQKKIPSYPEGACCISCIWKLPEAGNDLLCISESLLCQKQGFQCLGRGKWVGIKPTGYFYEEECGHQMFVFQCACEHCMESNMKMVIHRNPTINVWNC